MRKRNSVPPDRLKLCDATVLRFRRRATVSTVCAETLAGTWNTISLVRKRVSPIGGTPVKPRSPIIGRRAIRPANGRAWKRPVRAPRPNRPGPCKVRSASARWAKPAAPCPRSNGPRAAFWPGKPGRCNSAGPRPPGLVSRRCSSRPRSAGLRLARLVPNGRPSPWMLPTPSRRGSGVRAPARALDSTASGPAGFSLAAFGPTTFEPCRSCRNWPAGTRAGGCFQRSIAGRSSAGVWPAMLSETATTASPSRSSGPVRALRAGFELTRRCMNFPMISR